MIFGAKYYTTFNEKQQKLNEKKKKDFSQNKKSFN